MKTLPRNERLLELLADNAVGALSSAEIAELESLKAKEPGADFEVFDRAAAAVDLAFVTEIQSAPASLIAKLKADTAALSQTTNRTEPIGRIQIAQRPNRFLQTAGWLAAAACLAIAVAGWWPRLNQGGSRGYGDFASFKTSTPDAVSAPFGDFNDLTTGAPPEIRSVTGEVVWSDSAQTGFLKLKGMPANDPSKEQYQLWIIDGTRGLGQRISGAIFDVPKDIAVAKGEVIVRIDPQLHVNKAAIFAITIEQPGGVWVSDMTRRAVLAKLPDPGT